MKFTVSVVILALTFACSKSNPTNSTPDKPTPDKEYVKRNKKKGFCITTKDGNEWVQKLNDLHVSWHYSWGSDLKKDEPDSVEFVPMIWGAWGDFSGLDKKITKIKALADSGKVHYLLGFNEPDNKDQANMSVDDAIKAWPKLMDAGVKLGSPACVHADRTWMKQFMAKADSLEYRIDFVTVHWYGGKNADNFINYLKKIHDLYNRPIWITEFAVADWSAGSVSENKYTASDVKKFLSEVLPAMEKLNFVERYAWFSASTSSAALGTSALFDNSGNLTSVGKLYANYQ